MVDTGGIRRSLWTHDTRSPGGEPMAHEPGLSRNSFIDAQSDSLGDSVTGGTRIRDDDRDFERRSDLRQPERPANSGAVRRSDRLDRRARQYAPFAAAYRQAVQRTSSTSASGAARRGQGAAETREGDDAGITRTGGSCA